MYFTIPQVKIKKIKTKLKRFFKIELSTEEIIIFLDFLVHKSLNSRGNWVSVRNDVLDQVSVHYCEILLSLLYLEVLKIRDIDDHYKVKFSFNEEFVIQTNKVHLKIEDVEQIKRIKRTRKLN